MPTSTPRHTALTSQRSFALALSLSAALALSACAAGPAAPARVSIASPATAPAELAPGTRVAGLGNEALQPAPGRKIVRNASLELEVRKARQIGEILARGRKLADELGGYVATEREQGLVLKVPTDRLDESLSILSALGHVSRRTITAQDVTAQFRDLEIRVENARRLKGRLHELLSQTRDVKQILEVEKELARVTEELERMEGQVRLMSHQTRFATIDLKVREAIRPGPVGWIFKGLYVGTKWLFVWD
jgi:hypothetical protein